MTNEIVLSNITGIDAPYNVFGCDIYGNNCILIATVDRDIPPPLTLPLSPIFNTYPGVLLKLSNCSGCVDSEYLSCIEQPLLGLCFNLGVEATNTNPCHILPSGYYHSKPYYRMLDLDCLTPINYYVWWNNDTTRWELTNAVGSGPVCYYLNNPGNYPVSNQEYPWVGGDCSIILKYSILGECPEPMCFSYNFEAFGGNSVCTILASGFHNNKVYFLLLDSACSMAESNYYIWWNNNTTRWELTETLGSGLVLNYLTNPGNYPETNRTYSWNNSNPQIIFNYSLLGECPTMCIWWEGESIVGDSSPCETNPSGYHNGKIYYQMLDTSNNCSTTIPRYIWWNSGTTRWEVTETFGSGEVKWYNENPGNYPEGTSEYPWVWNGDSNVSTLAVIFGDCPEIMCFSYGKYSVFDGIFKQISCNPFPLGIHNGKYYYVFSLDGCNPTGPELAEFYLYWETSTSRWEIRTGIGSGTLYSYLNNPSNYPTSSPTVTWTNTQPGVLAMYTSNTPNECPTMCIYASGEGLGETTNCQTGPRGYHNNKVYYQLLQADCYTDSFLYIWWNSTNMRWEMTTALGSGNLLWYNENPGNYPEGTSEYPWVHYASSVVGSLSTILGDCPEPMCFVYYTEIASLSSCNNTFPVGIHNGKYYYGIAADLCSPLTYDISIEFYLYWETSTSRWEIRTGIGSGTLYSYLNNPDDYPVVTDVYSWNNTQPSVFEMFGSDFGSDCYSEA
jgi:hypothetical protein